MLILTRGVGAVCIEFARDVWVDLRAVDAAKGTVGKMRALFRGVEIGASIVILVAVRPEFTLHHGTLSFPVFLSAIAVAFAAAAAAAAVHRGVRGGELTRDGLTVIGQRPLVFAPR